MLKHMQILVRALTLSTLYIGLSTEALAIPPAPPPDTLAGRRDDAELTSVAFVDAERGWAVGDHGVVLHTKNAGLHWTPQTSGVGCRLRDVCFLDAACGWIVGGYYDPYVHRSRGVLLHTTDGGTTWRLEPTPLLPALRKIRMRNPQEGWAVGDPTPLAPSGIHLTRDGGRTWSAFGGNLPAGVVAADFGHDGGPASRSSSGAVASGRGSLSAVAERVLNATPTAELGLRTARDLLLLDDGRGWTVGDGGLVASTDDGGTSWNSPSEELQTGAGAQCDWRAIARHGSKLWIVGSPGSVVLHSPDAGRSWQLLPTGQPLPLADITFVDNERGFAVGALGTILATTDGGRTWKRQSYGDRRAALWSCFADAEAMPLELIARSCSEDGYRAAAAILGRRDLEPGTQATIAAYDRTADALSALGISATSQAWAFPLRQAALQLAAGDVLAAWGDGDDDEGLRRVQAHLVLQIRMWRPDVVITHAPAPRGDLPTNHLIHQLTMQAIDAAADPKCCPEQLELLQLAPWQVQKAFGHEPNQTLGTASVKTTEVLTRTATALDDFCSAGRALLFDRRVPAPPSVAVRMCMNRTPAAAPERDLFTGLVLPAGGDARRTITGVGGETIAKMRRAADRRRGLEGIMIQKSGTVGADLAGRLREVTAGLDDAAAGRAVFELAENFRLAGRWEAARETYEYILTRYPQHADSEAALHRLVRYLAAGEADHRLRRAMLHTADAFTAGPLGANATDSAATTATKPRAAASTAVAGNGILNQVDVGPNSSSPAQPADGDRLELLNVTIAKGPGTITTAPLMATPAAMMLGRNSEPLPTMSLPFAQDAAAPASSAAALIGYTGDEDRRRRCIAIGAYFENRDPVGHADPTILFALAAARRRLGQHAEAESFYKHFVRSHPEDAWWECAAAEAGLKVEGAASAKRRHRSLAAMEKPKLDGNLDDALWRTAVPLDLRSSLGDDAAWPAAAMIAHDAEYLYLAVRAKRTPEADMPAPTGPRQRDADLAAQDRVDFCLDLDRDYATYYKLSVDHRGWTAESCWDDKSWDPQWFVAAGGDEQNWIVEAAIPWSELAAEPPRSGDTWALGVQRIAPSIGVQNWTVPAGAGIRPETFGHLTFE